MEAVDAVLLETALRRHSRESSVARVLRLTSSPALAKGENYTSQMLRVEAALLLGSGREESRSFLVKRVVPLESAQGKQFQQEYRLFFDSEHRIYRDILPHIERVLKDHGEPDSKLWADCIGFVRSQDICFSDLKVQGFRLADRRAGLDLDHIQLVVRCLGQFHAASAVAASKCLFDPNTIRPYFMGRKDATIDSMFDASLDLLYKVILEDWSQEWKPIAEKLKEVHKDAVQKVCDLVNADTKAMKVVNHGDFWVNNMMFKYTGHMPTQLRFVDFQGVHYNTVGWDLVYFLYTSVRPALRESHLGSILSAYQASFSATLGLLQSDLTAPSLPDISADMARLSLYALVVVITILPIIMTESEEDVIHVDDMLSMKDKAEKTRVLLCNPKYVAILKSMLTDMFSPNK